MLLGLGVEQRPCRLARRRRTKGAIHRGSAQLLPAWLPQLIGKAAGEAEEDHNAQTLLSSPPMEGYGGVSSQSERSFQHDE